MCKFKCARFVLTHKPQLPRFCAIGQLFMCTYIDNMPLYYAYAVLTTHLVGERSRRFHTRPLVDDVFQLLVFFATHRRSTKTRRRRTHDLSSM